MKHTLLTKILGMFVGVALVLGVGSAFSAGPELFPGSGDYVPIRTYDGSLDPLQIFWSYDNRGPFRASRAPEFFDQLSCLAARDALSSQGFWEGTLEDDGRCGPGGDTKIWLIGNFVNFLAGS